MASSKKKAQARRSAPAGFTKAGAGARKAAAPPPRRPAPSKAAAQKPTTGSAADKPIRRGAAAEPPRPAAKPTVARPAPKVAAASKPAPPPPPATTAKPRSAAARIASRAAAAVASAVKGAAAAAKPSRSRAGEPPKPAPPAPKPPAAPKRVPGAASKPATSAARKPESIAAEPAAAPATAGRKVRPRVVRARKAVAEAEVEAPHAVDGLNEEDQIRAAKYLPRELPKRLFEEERFLFPETYGVNRIRLLVRDPEWIFAYWDVSPSTLTDLGRSLGERALALSRLTLRVLDPVGGGSSDILLPPGARWWYVRTDAARRTYRAELGVTLPSGQFRRIAESNTVVTPRVGPSKERARRRMSYPDAREIPVSAAEAAGAAEGRDGLATEPFAPGAVAGAARPGEAGTRAGAGAEGGKGGASDTFRPGGASDTFRPGASDSFRR